MMTEQEHRECHAKLHKSLDELVAEFIASTGNMPSSTTVTELMEWSYQQVQEAEAIPQSEHPEKKP